jgi:hypothetical protein
MDQRERFEAWRSAQCYTTPFEIELQFMAWQAAEAAALERAITTIQSDSDAAAELGHERFSRYCAEVVAKLRKLAAPVERGRDKS